MCAAFLFNASPSWGQEVVGDGPDSSFDRSIAPILATHCLACHRGPDAEGGLDLSTEASTHAGGESGPAIHKANPLDSLIWEKIRADEMPPEGPLPEAAKALLEEWLSSGAEWGSGEIDPFLFSSDRRAGYDWWSLAPLGQHVIPDVSLAEWPQNEVDHFILSSLEDRELRPSPRATPRELVRRLYFDLLGLPPDPETVFAFEANPSQAAWEALIDELLASNHYGERWAQHWLDVARFGETHGFEYNIPRDDAWHYRDWIIDSLNQDLPYDQFVRMQIAGDVIEPDSHAGAAAVGFLVAGIHNTVLGASDAMKLQGRHDELEEIAGTLAQTFLGITVNCARCHDHKFDPISTREYYQFVATLDGITHRSRTIRKIYDDAERHQIAKQLSELTRRLEQRLHENNRTLSSSSNRLTSSGSVSANANGEKYTVSFEISPTVWANAEQATTGFESLTLSLIRSDGSVLVGHDFYPTSWVDAGRRQSFETQSFAYLGDGTGELSIKLSASPLRWHFAGAIDNLVIRDSNERVLFSEDFDAFQERSNTGVQSDTGLKVFFGLQSDDWQHSGTNTVHAVEYEPNNFAVQIFSGAIDEGVQGETQDERELIQSLVSLKATLAGTTIFTTVGQNPRPMHLLRRGDVRQPTEVVEPGALKSVAGLDASFSLGSNATDAERRLRLANWVTNPDNGPFHRVIVNRIWHYHFGRGIVSTPNDLGFNGDRPSHPELLDWMSIWLRRHNYSMKSLHRLILSSATYQQSSTATRNDNYEHAEHVDSDNRFLWRQNSRRIDAEAFRDTVLAMSGSLNRKMFGPGYRDVSIETVGAAHFYHAIDPIGSEYNRRSIYRFRARGERSALLESFDCPDPSTTTPSRNVTTTASQLLSQWNNGFVVRNSEQLARRIESEFEATTRREQVEAAWLLVLLRPPTPSELQAATRLVETHGLALLCRVLFNCNELVVID